MTKVPDLLEILPIEIWTESEAGQELFTLVRRGYVRYTRINATFGRFEAIPPDERRPRLVKGHTS